MLVKRIKLLALISKISYSKDIRKFSSRGFSPSWRTIPKKQAG